MTSELILARALPRRARPRGPPVPERCAVGSSGAPTAELGAVQGRRCRCPATTSTGRATRAVTSPTSRRGNVHRPGRPPQARLVQPRSRPLAPDRAQLQLRQGRAAGRGPDRRDGCAATSGATRTAASWPPITIPATPPASHEEGPGRQHLLAHPLPGRGRRRAERPRPRLRALCAAGPAPPARPAPRRGRVRGRHRRPLPVQAGQAGAATAVPARPGASGSCRLRLGRGRYRWTYKLAPGARTFDAGSRRCTPIGPLVRKHLRAERSGAGDRTAPPPQPARVRGPAGIDCRAQTDEEVSSQCRNEDSPPTSPS